MIDSSRKMPDSQPHAITPQRNAGPSQSASKTYRQMQEPQRYSAARFRLSSLYADMFTEISLAVARRTDAGTRRSPVPPHHRTN